MVTRGEPENARWTGNSFRVMMKGEGEKFVYLRLLEKKRVT
jgi:hypothetical protein